MHARSVLAEPEPKSCNAPLAAVARWTLKAQGLTITVSDRYQMPSDPRARASHYDPPLDTSCFCAASTDKLTPWPPPYFATADSGFSSFHGKSDGCMCISHTDGEAKFWIEPTIEIALNQGLSKQQVATALALVHSHREEIVHAWHVHFGD